MVSMKEAERIRAIWDWLPAFRVVAEHEHLGRAAEVLHLSRPALSRTLGLLEEALGRPLFHRRGRGLQLNDEGRVLQTQVRDAMRWVDEAVSRIMDVEGAGIVRIGAFGVAAHVHVPLLVSRVVTELPGVEPRVSTPEAEHAAAGLLRGDLDLVLSSAAASAPELTVVPLARISNSIYCGPGHPLHGCEQPDVEGLLSHPFVAPPADAMGVTHEGWPLDRPRRIACELDRMLAGLEACASGAFLAVLPDVLAHRHPAELRALTAVAIDDIPVFAVRRRALGEADRMDRILDLLREIDAELTRSLAGAAD